MKLKTGYVTVEGNLVGWDLTIPEITRLTFDHKFLSIEPVDINKRMLKMKLYVTVCEDHHCDPEIKVWTNKDNAINYAKEFIKLYEGFEERTVQGWLYYAECCEDSVYVFETELDKL